VINAYPTNLWCRQRNCCAFQQVLFCIWCHYLSFCFFVTHTYKCKPFGLHIYGGTNATEDDSQAILLSHRCQLYTDKHLCNDSAAAQCWWWIINGSLALVSSFLKQCESLLQFNADKDRDAGNS